MFGIFWKVSGHSEKFPDTLESLRTVWKDYRNFQDTQETFRTLCKCLEYSGKFPDTLKSFQTLWKVYGQSGKFTEIFKILRKLSGQFENFAYTLESFQSVRKFPRVIGNCPDYLESSINVHKLSKFSTYFQQHCHNFRNVEKNSIRYRGSCRPHVPV